MIHIGDCREILRTLDAESVDAIVTDPPYGLKFMGKRWDYDVPPVELWAECLRVLKPGGYLLAFAGTRTQHRMAVRIEDAGFEIRDMIAWVYGSGFPKSLDVSKAIDKAAGVEGKYGSPKSAAHAGWIERGRMRGEEGHEGYQRPWMADERAVDRNARQYVGGTEAARQWEGWGTALKPALEPITVARKPLIGTVAANVLAHGTGALNIDGCRVAGEPWKAHRATGLDSVKFFSEGDTPFIDKAPHDAGRWPANLIHDGSDEVLALFPNAPGQLATTSTNDTQRAGQNAYGVMKRGSNGSEPRVEIDKSAARFFYCAKASREDRNAGCEGMPQQPSYMVENGSRTAAAANGVRYDRTTVHGNNHPTVKPTDLMRWLCRLVTPPGGTVLDPFTGSGSTGKAARLEGFAFIGIELDPDYAEIARRRIEDAQRQARLFA